MWLRKMDKKWLSYLVEPVSMLTMTEEIMVEDNGDIQEGTLSSPAGRSYPIIRGIPRFVPGSLYEESQEIVSDSIQTGRSFGKIWREGANRSLGNNGAERKLLEEQFLALLGINRVQGLSDLLSDGMNCLDAGCGVGWSEYLFNTNANVNRFAVDLSLSVEVARERTRERSNVCIVQADLLRLPFQEAFFDLIFSNGVLHHTENPKKAFESLCRHLKSGGLIAVYVYCVKPLLRETIDRELRSITTEMSYEECLRFSDQITKFGKALARIQEPLFIEEEIPLLGIKAGRYNLQRFVYDHILKCFYHEGLGHSYSVLANADWYHPKNATHHTREEIEEWFRENKITDAKFSQPEGWEHSGYFVSGRKSG